MTPDTPQRAARRRQPELFLTRELSWLEFDARVLEEARDAAVPALERLKFAAIAASNLDEFFMVRVGGLQQAIAESDTQPDLAGLTPAQQLALISEKAHQITNTLYATLIEEILPALSRRGVCMLSPEVLDASQQTAMHRYFHEEVMPALTPLAIDASRPFPMLANLSLNLALLLEPEAEDAPPRLAVVQVPGRLPRLVRLPGTEASFLYLEDLISAHLQALFPGQTVLESVPFRIARDAELELDDEGGASFLAALEEELRKRRRSLVVRLEVQGEPGPALLATLAERLEVDPQDIYREPGPLDLRALMSLYEIPALGDLRDKPLRPLPLPELAPPHDLFAVLDERDILLHHPYDSFDPVVALVTRAVEDPDVLAIKQTLYRTSGDSPIVRALARAAEAGKQVTVLVELLARFDEQSNIRWARSLEEAGAHVIYGIKGFKTHAKVCLVVRRGSAGIRRYVHLGTGNYNDRTARLYTDMGLMTSNREIGEDASSFFNALTGYSDPPRMKKLVMAPTGLRARFLDLIRRERRRAEEGQPAEIRAKMNSLVDEEIIRALYEASQAGVAIRLNVRGICCLRPGLKKVSETIEVISVVDRFLEHTRIFYFRNGGNDEVYLSSADWMQRNLDRRIELLFPVQAADCKRKVLEALDIMFADTVKARVLQPDGGYKRRKPAKGDEPIRAQIRTWEDARRLRQSAEAAAERSLEPLAAPDPEAGKKS